MELKKRCPNGTRKNRKTGICEPTNTNTTQMNILPKKRCPNGTRKNRKTGICEPTHKIDYKVRDTQPTKPKNIPTPTKTKMPETILQFHSKSKLLPKGHVLPPDALRRLSNFSEDPVEFEGHEYPSVEHAFQGQKYKCSNKPEQIESFYNGTIKTPLDAKSAGSKSGMKKVGAVLDISCWTSKSEDIMRELIASKISKNADIQNILKIAKENNIRFVHFSRMDMIWGAHVDASTQKITKGMNKLGEIYNSYSQHTVSAK